MGDKVGKSVGLLVGFEVGLLVGFEVGVRVGVLVGRKLVGSVVGSSSHTHSAVLLALARVAGHQS